MALAYPKRQGYLYSHKSLTVMEGSELMSKSLLSAKISPSIEGRKIVMGNGRKALGRTRGELKVEAELAFEWTSFAEYIKAHPQMLDEVHNFTYVWEEGADRIKVEIQDFTFDGFDIPSEGTEEIKIELKGAAFDCLINDTSLIIGDALGLDEQGATT